MSPDVTLCVCQPTVWESAKTLPSTALSNVTAIPEALNSPFLRRTFRQPTSQRCFEMYANSCGAPGALHTDGSRRKHCVRPPRLQTPFNPSLAPRHRVSPLRQAPPVSKSLHRICFAAPATPPIRIRLRARSLSTLVPPLTGFHARQLSRGSSKPRTHMHAETHP